MIKITINEKIVNKFADKYTDIIFDKLNKNINNGFKFNNKKVSLYKREKQLFRKIFTKQFIKLLLTSKPNKLKTIIQKCQINMNKSSNIYKTMYNAFISYTYENKFDKFNFIQNIGLKSCPYCNRNYIFTINSNRNLKPEIDHFYPKHLYPYLGMSFYNLIPSCPVCNGFGAKGKKDSFKDNLKNPYEIETDDFKFNFDIKSIDIIDNKKNENSIEIKLYKNINPNNEYFKLEALYNEHKDIVLELIQKREIYPDSYIDELTNQYPNMFKNKEDILRLITCGYVNDKDLHKRPLSKLIKDISEQLDII